MNLLFNKWNFTLKLILGINLRDKIIYIKLPNGLLKKKRRKFNGLIISKMYRIFFPINIYVLKSFNLVTSLETI